jgi:hypothetical protein
MNEIKDLSNEEIKAKLPLYAVQNSKRAQISFTSRQNLEITQRIGLLSLSLEINLIYFVAEVYTAKG